METDESVPQSGVEDRDIGSLLLASVSAQERYAEFGNESDIKLAVQYLKEFIDLLPDDYPARVDGLNNLGSLLELQYDKTGELNDLEEAIAVSRQGLDLTNEDHCDYATFLDGLGGKLEKRYEQLDDAADLEEAISLTKKAIDLTAGDDPQRGISINNLGNRLLKWYMWTKEVADLDEAIAAARRAVDAIGEDHPDRATCFDGLGTGLESRYERTGELADLDEAIKVAKQAVDLAADSESDRARCFSNLGNKYELRFERTGELIALEEAITAARQAVDLAASSPITRASYVNNLGSKLAKRYDRLDEIADLEEAIMLARQAVNSTPEGNLRRLIYMHNVAVDLERLYEARGLIVDLNEAIEMDRKVVALVADNYHDRPACFDSLGNKLEKLYEHTGEADALEEAIAVARQAVDSTPEDHPDRVAWLINLGVKLEMRFERDGELKDAQAASDSFHGAWECQSAVPFHRVKAAARSLKLLAIQGKLDTAISLGKGVVDLLPTINTRQLRRDDQQFVMSTFAGIAADLCSVFLEAGQPNEALEYLEKVRAAIIGQIIDNRSDLSDLITHHPQIASRYEELLNNVNTPLDDLEPGPYLTQALNRRREAVTALDACVEQIRTLPGQERFLLGLTIPEMQECASDGIIVIVNVTDFRSDAIFVSVRTIKTVNLPKLLAADARIWIKMDWNGSRRERGEKNLRYSQYLSWLWDVCVKKVVDELGPLREPSAHDHPRIWWIGTGLASSLPFHAAGSHSIGSMENAYSKIISSYTPSIKALAYSQGQAKRSKRASGSLLMIVMPTTPGHRPLPGVIEEKEEVIKVADGYLDIDTLEMPNADRVVESVRCCSTVHFACHGSTDHLDPSKSSLIFQKSDESDSPKEDTLTVYRISNLSLPHARLAYLSACSTAQNKVAQLTDEVIHVVSGFQVAGFPHAVGCLWPSVDRVCVYVAKEFYGSLLRRDGAGWTDRDVASALREAVMVVKTADFDMPLNWAQFVHYGA